MGYVNHQNCSGETRDKSLVFLSASVFGALTSEMILIDLLRLTESLTNIELLVNVYHVL